MLFRQKKGSIGNTILRNFWQKKKPKKYMYFWPHKNRTRKRVGSPLEAGKTSKNRDPKFAVPVWNAICNLDLPNPESGHN
jgi:hypothetical protein